MNKKIKIISSLIIIFISVIPLLILTFYVHPATDDFGFAYSPNDDSIWKKTFGIYMNMDNRLVGNFLTLLFCQTNNFFLFRLQFFLFILLFFSSVFFLFHTINKFLLKCRFEDLFLLFAFFVFLFIGYNPGIVECFFWYPGIIVWILSIVLFNIFLSLIIYELSSKQKSNLRFIIITLLVFVMASENEIMFIFMGIFGCILIYDLIKTRSQDRNKVVILLLVLIICAGIVILGPGNYARLKFISNEQPVSYFQVIKYNSLLFRKIFFLYGIVIFNIILIPFYYSVTKNTTKFIAPSKLLILSLALLLVLLLPSFIAKLLYSFRIQNVVYYFSLLLVFINFINLSIWFREKKILEINHYGKFLSLFIVYFFLSYFLQKQTTLRTAYSDIFTKRAMLFDKEMNERYKKIRSSKEDNIILLPLKNKPKTIYEDDITTNAEDWKNSVYSNYFDKKTIVLSDEENDCAK